MHTIDFEHIQELSRTPRPQEHMGILRGFAGSRFAGGDGSPLVHLHRLRAWVRQSGFGWGLAALAVSVPPVLLLIELAGSATSVTSRLVVASLLAQLPVVVGAAALWGYRRAGRLSEVGEVVELGTRAELAEAELDRDHELLHELRATVVGITLSHRMLHDRHTELPSSTRSRLERLHDAELTRLERLLADRSSDETVAVDLGGVIDPLVDTLRIKGHQVHWEGTRCRAWARPDDVAEIVHVLLENAARHAPGHDVDVTVVPRGDTVDVRVRDRGPGISPTVAPSLFERGARGPDSPGQGIGLHIAQRLAQEMGGQLRLDRTPDASGAAFVLTLPCSTGVASCLGRSD